MSDAESVEAVEFSGISSEDEDISSEVEKYVRTLGLNKQEWSTHSFRDNVMKDSAKQSPFVLNGSALTTPSVKSKSTKEVQRKQENMATLDEPKMSKKDKKTLKASKMSKKDNKRKFSTEDQKKDTIMRLQDSKRVKKKTLKTTNALEKINKMDTLTVTLQGYQPGTSRRLLYNWEVAGPWFEEVITRNAVSPKLPVSVLKHLQVKAEELLSREVSLYEKVRMNRNKSDAEWLKTVLSSGTLADKMAARALLIQESPVHNLATLNVLLNMATKKGKRESIQAVDTLKELWLTALLPPTRKLKEFNNRPFEELFSLSDAPLDKELMLWLFEDKLKKAYAQYVNTLQQLLQDPVATVRSKLVGNVFDLLLQRPEQEQLLLSLLVNKLGDPDAKVTSKATFFLLKLVSQHGNMRAVVAREVERLLFRPNLSERAQYCSICFLNQLYLKRSDAELAGNLIKIYFMFFKAYVKKKEFDVKLLSALLTGVNRAFPYARENSETFEEYIETLFDVINGSPISTATQALMLLYQVMESRQTVSERYYKTLYIKLLDQQICTMSKQGIFLNVLYKSVSSDPQLARTKAFLKRILQTCGHHSPPFICACLMTVSEVVKGRPQLWSYILSAEADDEEHFEDIPLSDEEAGPSKGKTQKLLNNEKKLYQGMEVNPLTCKAEHTCLWELKTLSDHYHPSVASLAATLLKGTLVDYSGDPLQDFTLTRFLDRFVYKNPKLKQSDHGGSIMQRMKASNQKMDEPVNSAKFASLEESEVREDEKYLYKFFQKQNTKAKRIENTKTGNNQIDLDNSEQDFLEKMDFASEFEQNKSTKKTKGKVIDSSDEEEEEDWGMEGEPSTEDFERVLLENITSSEDEDDERPLAKKSKSASKDIDDADLFAAADEFAHILEGGTASGRRSKRRDESGAKQMRWEEARERRFTGRHRKFSKHKRKNTNSNKMRTN